MLSVFFVVVEDAREEEKISIENTFMHIDINSKMQMEMEMEQKS